MIDKGSPTILVVEDDEDVRESLRAALELADYHVVTAANGQEGIDFLNRSPTKPDLILLDLMMPVMDGWEFDLALGESPDTEAIPVVIITAFSGAPRLIRHPERILHKPVPLDALLQTVARFCGKADAQYRVDVSR